MKTTLAVSSASRRDFLASSGILVVGGILASGRVFAEDAMDGMDYSHHHHDHTAAPPTEVKRSEVDYVVPSGVFLVRQDGKKVEIAQELDQGKPVILSFIYTSCTAICPVTSQVLSQVQKKLGNEINNVNMVSISIDPEYDTPQRLLEYAKKYGAKFEWQHYTGTVEASVAMQRAFDIYRGDKMNHIPVTYLRGVPVRPWVRLDGFASPDEILHEYNALVKRTG